KMIDHLEKQEITFKDSLDELKTQINDLKARLDNKKFVQEEVIKPVEVKKEVVLEPEDPFNFDKMQKEFEGKVETTDVTLEEQSKPILDSISTDKLYTSEDIEKASKIEPKITEKIEQFKPIIEEKIEPENVVEETESTTKENDLFNPEFEVPEKEEIPYSTYDIRYVEDVLNNANREVKIDMNKKWFDIERNATHQDISYAKMITEGRLVATDAKFIIIEYENASICNRMMKPEIKEKIVDLLSRFYQKDLDYLALPKDIWYEKSSEFIKKWRNNEVNIKLSPIVHNDLVEIPLISDEIEDMTPDSVKEAINIFGSDTVKVKRGDK
ncbi:MAG: hypothetical protein QM489_05500, partial [Candidatus Izemoplasma sp.]